MIVTHFFIILTQSKQKASFSKKHLVPDHSAWILNHFVPLKQNSKNTIRLYASYALEACMKFILVTILTFMMQNIALAEAQPDFPSIEEETSFKFEFHDSVSGNSKRDIATSKPVKNTTDKEAAPAKTERDVAGIEEKHPEEKKRELRYWDYEKEAE